MDSKKMTAGQALGYDRWQNCWMVYLRGFHLVGLECFCMAFQSAAVWVHGSLCHADGSLSSHGNFLADYRKKGLTKPFLHVIMEIQIRKGNIQNETCH